MNSHSLSRNMRFTLLGLVLLVTACSPLVVVEQPATVVSTPAALPTVAIVPTVQPTAIPTILPTSLPTVQTSCIYRATFVADVTIPDNSALKPGLNFVKTWRIRNDGTCAWGTNGHSPDKLIFTAGNQLGAPASVPLPADVQPGSTFDLSVNMVAPAAPGNYASKWLLAGANGLLLGFGGNNSYPLIAQIVVGGSIADAGCQDSAQYINDDGLDGTTYAPNTPFTKTWTVKNTGSCNWDSNYLVFQLSGAFMTQSPGYLIVQSGHTVTPGQTVNISIGMTSPVESGNYISYWGLKKRNGQFMPIQGGSGGNSFYVVVNVNNNGVAAGEVTAESIDIEPEQGSGPACISNSTYFVHASITTNGPAAAYYEIGSTAGQIPAGNFLELNSNEPSIYVTGTLVFDQAGTKTINLRFVGPYPHPDDITENLRVNGGEWHNTKLACQ